MPPPVSLHAHFAALPDPRVDRTRRHLLLDIVTIAVCAVICGADTFVDIARFGHAKEAWLRRFLTLPHGIPSHDTFGRVFAALDPDAFETAFLGWIRQMTTLAPGEVVAIDGKAVRRSHDRARGQPPLHVVSAWASAHQLVLGPVVATGPDGHGSEVAVIPALLRTLALDGAVVTIDAIGTQPTIAAQVRAQGADYVLALTANQPTLHELVADHVRQVAADAPGAPSLTTRTAHRATVDKDHGRVELRECWATDDPAVLDWLDPEGRWPDRRSIAAVTGERRQGATVTRETRYYLSSLPADAARLGTAVRAHWGIETQLHWVLDVAFHEDASRVRTGHAAANLAVVRKLALNLLRQEPTATVGIAARRKMAGWDETYLLKVLAG